MSTCECCCHFLLVNGEEIDLKQIESHLGYSLDPDIVVTLFAYRQDCGIRNCGASVLAWPQTKCEKPTERIEVKSGVLSN